MFKALSDTAGRDTDYPERQHRLNMLTRVLDGSLYDHLLYPFSTERLDGTGEYIPIHKRRPSARYRLCGTVVDDSVSLLFSDGRFPTIDCQDEATRDGLAMVIKDARLPGVMIDAATRGSVGSVCLWLRVMKLRVFVEALDTQFLTPAFDPQCPDRLLSVTERYKVRGSVLKERGYAIDDDDTAAMFWFQRVWDDQAETWFVPVKVVDKVAQPPVDARNSVTHGLGFCPMIWIRNLPGGVAPDGASTMVREALDTQVEIDYQLSQAGRGLRYASDPTLLIKEPSGGDSGPIARTASQALIVSADGDAKLLEINGTAAEAVMNYVRGLRDLALESLHGNRANADKLSAAQSGRAMELMNQALIWLADRLRTSYGDGGVLPLLRMIIAVRAKFALVTASGAAVPAMIATDDIALRWPKWFSPTYADGLTQSQTFETLVGGGLMSRETAVHNLAPDYDIEDPKAEVAKIEAEQAATAAAAVDQSAALAAATPPKPGKPPLSASDD
jgi:hypothetical protein